MKTPSPAFALAHWLALGQLDELGGRDTPVHRLDARAKALVTLAFIGVVMSFPRDAISALMPLALYPSVLLSVGRIPARAIILKLILALPFALAVGLFNPLLDTRPVVPVGPFVITGGWLSFASIMARFALTVTAALALVACTGMVRLGAGLEGLGLPRLFVAQLLLLYRYLFVVAQEGGAMARAVELRAVGGLRGVSLRMYGSLLGRLLLRSLDRSERVHGAMVARGFNGEIRVLKRPAFRAVDGLFVVGCLVFFAVARRWNLAELLGGWLTH